MYANNWVKFFTDGLLPFLVIFFFKSQWDMHLEDYDTYEKDNVLNFDLQELLNDKEFETVENMIHSKQEVKAEAPTSADQDTTNYFIFVMFAYVVSTLLFVKFKNQLEMNSNLNNVIKLVEASISDAKYFLIYYMFLLMFFCIQFMILGAVVLHLDYPGLDDNEQRYPYYFVQNFRNSLGDLQTPAYKFWEDYGSKTGNVVIYIIWATWIANFIFSSLLMLNFLITVFSETHERVLTNQLEYTYKKRAELNVECMSLMTLLHLFDDIVFSVITLSSEEDEQEEDAVKGVIANLTGVIQEHTQKVSKDSNSRLKNLKE